LGSLGKEGNEFLMEWIYWIEKVGGRRKEENLWDGRWMDDVWGV